MITLVMKYQWYIDSVFLPVFQLDEITTIELMPKLKIILFIRSDFVDFWLMSQDTFKKLRISIVLNKSNIMDNNDILYDSFPLLFVVITNKKMY